MNFRTLDFKYICVFLSIVSFSFNIKSQDVEKILNSPIVAASGGVSFNEVTYFADDASKKRDPFIYYVNGNLNLTALGTVSMPFTFSYSNQKVDYQTSLPFNRFSFTPSYKWATAYIGYASLSYSPYTVSGHEFFGFGCQLSPFSSFKFSMLVGRFKEVKEKDTSNLSLPAVYNRMGAGFKTEIVKEKISLAIIMFKAYDEKNSINQTYLKDSIDPKPKG